MYPMKKALSILLAVLLVLSVAPVSLAATAEADSAASRLYQLGLFAGTGSNPDGTPIFGLDRKPDRSQGITMLVALLGKADEAKQGSWRIPFTDVPTWAKPAVGYAYTNGITKGVSATKFGGGQPLTASQYVTFVLTALGYQNGVDFQWQNPFSLSDQLGITGGRYKANSAFARGDVAIISNNALSARMKNLDKTLLDSLMESGAVAGTPTPNPPTPGIPTPNPPTPGIPTPTPSTPSPAPTVDTVQSLVQYIIANGTTNNSGYKEISAPISQQTTSFISYDQATNQLFFNGVFLSEDKTGGTATTIIYDVAKRAFQNPLVFLFSAGESQYSMTANISPDTYLPNTTLTFSRYQGSTSVDPSIFQNLANTSTQGAVAAWADHMASIGLNLSDLGFAAFLRALKPNASTPTPAPTTAPTPTPTSAPTPGIPAGNKGAQLAQYISTYGKADKDGEKFIDAKRTESNLNIITNISYDQEENALWFFSMIKTASNYTTCLLLEYDLANNAFDSYTYFSYEDTKGLELTMSTSINPATYTKNTVLNFQKVKGPDTISLSDANQIANQTSLVSVLAWALQLQDIGYDIADFGFTSFGASLGN